MNATERARRSDALYYDNISRRELCDRIANLESDLEDSKAKNAKTFEVGKRWMARAARFESENTKLRELVRHLYECMCNVDADGNHECDSCEYNDAESECDFERLMRELGIEV